MGHVSIEAILRLDRRDAGCGTTCAVLERVVEAEVGGEDAAARFPAAVRHLDRCPACRADHDGLLEAFERYAGVSAEPRR
jgi:predicted anti-sigma-YlaC factor YlaD